MTNFWHAYFNLQLTYQLSIHLYHFSIKSFYDNPSYFWIWLWLVLATLEWTYCKTVLKQSPKSEFSKNMLSYFIFYRTVAYVFEIIRFFHHRLAVVLVQYYFYVLHVFQTGSLFSLREIFYGKTFFGISMVLVWKI